MKCLLKKPNKTNKPPHPHRSVPWESSVGNLVINHVWHIINLTWSSSVVHINYSSEEKEGKTSSTPTGGNSNPKFTADLLQTLARADIKVHPLFLALRPPDVTHGHLTERCPPFSTDQRHNKNSMQKAVQNTSPCTPGGTDHNILSRAMCTRKAVMCHPKKGDAFALTFCNSRELGKWKIGNTWSFCRNMLRGL